MPEFDISDGLRKELEAKPYAENLHLFKNFSKYFGISPKIVYHPCAGTDTSAKLVFASSRVIYVEQSPNAVEALRKVGAEVFEGDATTFRPDVPVDVLILQNPQIDPDGPIETVAPGGYVICNDYYGTAQELKSKKDFKLLGALVEDDSMLDTNDLDDYWKTIETDTELINPKMRDYYLKIIKIFEPEFEGDVIKKYLEIVRATKEKWEAEHPDEPFIPMVQAPNRPANQPIALVGVPRKKPNATTNTLFVFQKAPVQSA